jgi:predicted acetyltransferase
MAGAFRAYELTQHLHGSAYPMMGLGAVAVDETVRRRGIGRQLCVEAIRIARARGDVLSVLYPFRPAFYEALGWGHVGELHAFRFRPESLLRAEPAEVLHAGADDANALAACYARVAAATNGLIARTPRIWRQHLDGDSVHAYMTGAPRAAGYLIARFSRSRAPDERALYIHELVADTQQAYAGLLGWIAAQRDAWRVIFYDATPDEYFEHRLADPRTPGFRSARYLWAPVYRCIRGPMLRILDIPAAIEQRLRWGPADPLRFGLEVGDDIVPENNGPFTIDFDGRRATVSRAATRPTLRTSARGFAQIFAGELQVTDAVRLDLAEVAGDAFSITALFRSDRCFRLLDEF